MGLPWMNVCRGHIMLTLVMCSGPLGVWCQGAVACWQGPVAYLPPCLLGSLLCCLHHLGKMYTDAAMTAHM